MMLFIDTSDFETGFLALLDKEFLASKSWDNKKSDILVSKIKELLTETGKKVSDLKKIAVVIGPGPFSRVRSGVAAANALGFALGVNIIGVPAAEEIDITQLLIKKGSKMVKPLYAAEPNITMPKKKVANNK